MAKGKVQISVEADTSKASAAIKKLKKDTESTNFAGFGKGLKDLSGSVSGLEGVGSAIGGIQKALSALGTGGLVGGGVGLVAGTMLKSMNAMVERGVEAQKAFEGISTALTTLDRNVGGAGRNMDELTSYLQSMSANGVNSFEDLGQAAQSLMISTGGSVSRTKELLNVFNDLAAGTGVQVSDWASMASEVQLTGVSIKDLTRLSNKGIPIYQALGDAMGVTAEQAEAMAKAGQLGTEDWMNAVKELHKVYNGLASDMSNNTLQGVIDTFEASKQMRDRPAGEGYSDSRRRYLSEETQEIQAEAGSPGAQAIRYEIGKVKGNLENLGDSASTVGDKLIVLANVVGGLLQGKGMQTQADEAMEEYRQAMAQKQKADVDSAFENRAKLTSGQIRDIINMISSDQWGAFGGENGLSEEYLAKRKELRELEIASAEREREAAAEAAAAAERERVVQATLKYGEFEDKVKAVSERNGIPKILDPSEIAGIIANIKKGIIEGTEADVPRAEDNLKILEGLQREYERQTREAARAEEELAKAREKSAEAAAKAAEVAAQMERDESKLYVSEKGKALKELSDAQAAFDKANDAYKKFQEEQQMRAEEEAQGIYRDKWKGMDVASVTSKGAELLKAQDDARAVLEQQAKKAAEFDQKWQATRDNINRFMSACVSGAVVKVKGTALAG